MAAAVGHGAVRAGESLCDGESSSPWLLHGLSMFHMSPGHLSPCHIRGAAGSSGGWLLSLRARVCVCVVASQALPMQPGTASPLLPALSQALWPLCREVMLTEPKLQIPRFSAGDENFRASAAELNKLDAVDFLLPRDELCAAVSVAQLSR